MTDDDMRDVEEQGGSLLAPSPTSRDDAQGALGLGPVQTKSYMMDDLLLIVMRGGMTTAERTLLEFGQHDLVRSFRHTGRLGGYISASRRPRIRRR